MKSIKNFFLKHSTFLTLGPFIGTFCIAITSHSSIFQRDPQHFLHGLITPSIVLPMIAALILITPFGYLFGIIPASITKLLFERFFENKISDANLAKAVLYGLILSLMWSPFLFILTMLITWNNFNIFLYIQFILIFPSTMICTLIEWKKSQVDTQEDN